MHIPLHLVPIIILGVISVVLWGCAFYSFNTSGLDDWEPAVLSGAAALFTVVTAVVALAVWLASLTG